MVVMGRVRAPHGIKGWIKVQPFTEQVDGLLGYPEWWLGRGGRWTRHQVAEAAVHGATVVARIDGCEDRDAAALLKGAEVAIPRERLPANADGEYYWSDLLGMEVSNCQGVLLGKVEQLLDTGANQVLVLPGSGKEKVLVPFIEGVIVRVDVAGGRMVVNWENDY
jgi:16S rRNA processing protein RimM